MSILEGIKAQSTKFSTNNKFIIKSKPNLHKENRQVIDSDPEIPMAADQDVAQFIAYMIERSKRFEELMAANSILNEEEFCKKHLFGSTCIKTILKSILDKLLSEKRLGRNLKGMNKSNMIEIENCIWNSIEREVALYQNERKYTRERDQLKRDIENRKIEILKSLDNVSLRFEAVEKELCLDSNQDAQNSSQANIDRQTENQESAEEEGLLLGAEKPHGTSTSIGLGHEKCLEIEELN